MANKVTQLPDIKNGVSSVQLQTLIINSDCLPLSVFKQLPNKPFLDYDTLEPQGRLWGRVNCYWNEETDWLVWDQEGTLYVERFDLGLFIDRGYYLKKSYFISIDPFSLRKRAYGPNKRVDTCL